MLAVLAGRLASLAGSLASLTRSLASLTRSLASLTRSLTGSLAILARVLAVLAAEGTRDGAVNAGRSLVTNVVYTTDKTVEGTAYGILGTTHKYAGHVNDSVKTGAYNVVGGRKNAAYGAVKR
jgi:hypothetical protein